MIRLAVVLSATLALVVAARAGEPSPDLAAGFRQPPDSARPWAYWGWLDGNLTRDGLTADLEAMKRAGLGGALALEVEQGTPPGPVRFGTPAWLEMFRHVCAEAHRLGLQVGFNNDAGWSGSGGPWITPELSMQKLEWTETVVHGPGRFQGRLPQPLAEANFYRDIAVFAFPTPAGEGATIAAFSPKITTSASEPGFAVDNLLDGDPRTTVALPRPEAGRPVYLQLEFARPLAARLLTLDMRLTLWQTCHCLLQISDDDREFKTIREFEAEASKQTYGFPDATARYFRLLFTCADPALRQLVIGELNLDSRYRIEDIATKALFMRKREFPGPAEFPGRAHYPSVPAESTIDRARLVNLTSRLEREDRLSWEVPAGSWTILRMGHSSTGETNHPAPPEGRGLECDKLSKEAADRMFSGLTGRLIAEAKPFVPGTLVCTHIDSWEIGSQNWTPRFREEFRHRRGYDPIPFLPVITGRIAGDLEVSERFLWDFRQTISELLSENYAGQMSRRARQNGLSLSIEAYGENPADDLTYAGRADVPMAEFWSWDPYGMAYSCTELASAAHVYGKRILRAEAFTATAAERWLGHPFAVKVYGDWAFCEGINHFVIHRYAAQPWTDPPRSPGMSMGPWGLHYERTQTWWEQARAWHEYLARCQYMLQQGLFVADVCYLAAETPPQRWKSPGKSRERPGYNFDACPAEVVRTRMSVKHGEISLPDGVSYRLLALPDSETMTPQLLAKIRDLVKAGATVLGSPPAKSPSLSKFPDCDAEVRRLAREIWGDCDGRIITEHRLGKGRVVRGPGPAEVLAAEGVLPDFAFAATSGAPSSNASAPSLITEPSLSPMPLRYIHKAMTGADFYFVANKNLEPVEGICSFRVRDRRPELWWPDTGKIERPAVYDQVGDAVRVPLRLDPCGSVFVVFRAGLAMEPDRITSVSRNAEPLLGTAAVASSPPAAPENSDCTNTFTMAVWVRPEATISLPAEADTGVSAFNIERNDALYPPPGDDLYADVSHSGAGLSVGVNGVCVLEHSANYFAPLLVWAAPLTNWRHVAVVYRAGRPSLYLDGRLAHEGLQSYYTVHAGAGVQHRRGVAPFRGGLGQFQRFGHALGEPQLVQLMQTMPIPSTPSPTPALEIARTPNGGCVAHVWQPGTYVARNARGDSWSFDVPTLPSPFEIPGPWDLRFTPRQGAPERVSLDRLISWSDHPDPRVKFFSGAGTYSKKFRLPPGLFASGRRMHLDLGQVHIMAAVKLNGKQLGVLWKPPFRVDITEAAIAGDNALEIEVVNLWVNRMIGDEQLPEDSARNPDGTLREWPDWLQHGRPSPTGRYTFTSWRLWKKDSPLQPSGLLGPVRVLVTQEKMLPPL